MIEYLSLYEISKVYQPKLSETIDRVVKSGYYLYGTETKSFEKIFAEYCGTKYCYATANGLDALTLILMAYKHINGWKDGDEVIVSANTFVATVLSIIRAGLQPVICDATLDDYLIDVSRIERLLTPRTRVIMPVHIYGAVCDMESINSLASSYHLKVVEDAAQAHGATLADGRKTGSLGDAGAFSFYPGKNLGALSDAGAVVSDDQELIETVRTIANYGAKEKYHHILEGINSRIDEIQAAVLKVKLPYLDKVNARRREIAEMYNNGIQNPKVLKPYLGKPFNSVYHVYPVFCKERDRLMQYLSDNGVKTLIHYPQAICNQKALHKYMQGQVSPNAEQICETELSLPDNSVLRNEDINRIVELINLYR